MDEGTVYEEGYAQGNSYQYMKQQLAVDEEYG